MFSMLYTVNLGYCDYVLFLQIQSHMLEYNVVFERYGGLKLISSALPEADSNRHLFGWCTVVCSFVKELTPK